MFNKPFFFKSQQQVSLCVVNINQGKYKTGFLMIECFFFSLSAGGEIVILETRPLESS